MNAHPTSDDADFRNVQDPLSLPPTTGKAIEGLRMQCYHEGCQHHQLTGMTKILQGRLDRQRKSVKAIRIHLEAIEQILQEIEA